MEVMDGDAGRWQIIFDGWVADRDCCDSLGDMTVKLTSGCRLYGFLDAGYLAERDPVVLTHQLIAGGVDVIQVRAKDWPVVRLTEVSVAVVHAAAAHRVPVIINDNIEAAFESGAAGVHLGQEDWAAIPRAERVSALANLKLVGISTHSLEQAIQAERDGASYIGVGPVYATGTKPHVTPVGLELVWQVSCRVHLPFFAIGGITLDRLPLVLAAGASRVAVVSAILNATDVTAATRAFKDALINR